MPAEPGPHPHRTVLVTGGAGGLGRTLTAALRAAGDSVAALDLAPAPEATLSVVGDVTDPDVVERAVTEVATSLGPIDALVCASGAVDEHPITDLDPADWHRVIDASLTATFLACRAVLPGMVARGRGRVVACSSGYATKGYRFGAHYAAAKAGVEALVKSAALEVGPSGVTVNAVAPGPFETPMLDHIDDRRTWQAGLEAATPLGRVGRPEDVVAAIRFLLDDAGFVTGQVLHVNGGLLMP